MTKAFCIIGEGLSAMTVLVRLCATSAALIVTARHDVCPSYGNPLDAVRRRLIVKGA